MLAAQLASNAPSNIAPGGGPVGAALQYRMLVRAGLDGPSTVSALTAVNPLVVGVVLVLPVLAIPALLRGAVDRTLLAAALAGLAAYMTLLAALAALGSHPRPSLVLLAFCGARALANIPITPGDSASSRAA